MRRTELLKEIRKMRFEGAFEGWDTGKLSQGEAARLLGVFERTFRRYLNRYEERGLEGLIDKRLDLIKKPAVKGKHHKRRDRCPWPGMMLHQDALTNEWVPGKKWDLVVTMDDATNEHYSMFFVDQ
jgi:Helix-turn-helix domain